MSATGRFWCLTCKTPHETAKEAAACLWRHATAKGGADAGPDERHFPSEPE